MKNALIYQNLFSTHRPKWILTEKIEAIVTDQDPNLTEFSLSVPLLKKVSNYFGKKSKDIKIDYCLVLTNKETRSRMMQKMNLQGSSITTQKNIKTGHLRGKVELNLYAVLAEDVAVPNR